NIGSGAGDLSITNSPAYPAITGGQEVYTFSLTPIADGPVTVKYLAGSAHDLAGNVNMADSNIFSITYDGTAPDTLIDTGPSNPSSSASATFTFHGTDTGSGVASFACDLDGGGFTAGTSPKNYTGLSDTSHTFQVRVFDTAGNSDVTPAIYTWTVAAPPVVVSIARANPNPASTSSVDFTVTFSESVTGVDLSDFALTTTSISGSGLSGLSGSGSIYTVTVNTGSGNGTIRLDVVDDDSIMDAVSLKLGGIGTGNGNYTSGQAYTVLKNTGPDTDTTGVFRSSNGLLYLKNSNTTGIADVAINYGIAGDYPVA